MISRWLSTKNNITWEVIFDVDPPLFITYPHAKLPGSSAPKFTTISGHFKVTLKKPEHFVAMVAKLVPKYQCKFKDLEDKGELSSLACKIDIQGKEYPGGIYDFPFVFQLPCEAWPCRHVTVEENEGVSIPFDWTVNHWYALQLHIVKHGADGLSHTWTDEVPKVLKRPYKEADYDVLHSFYIDKFFTLAGSPVDPGELPPPLQRVIEEFAPQTGPMTVILSARCMNIGAILNLSFSLPAVPSGSTITQIQGILVTHSKWISPKRDGPTWPHPDYKTTFFKLKSPFGIEASGDGQTYGLSASTSARLPNDRETMPSSLKHTLSPLWVSHSLIIEFEVRESPTRKHTIKLTEPITLASCRLISEWVNVPNYYETPPTRADFQPTRPDQRVACSCGFSISQLLAREEEGIAKVEIYEPPVIKPRSERDS